MKPLLERKRRARINGCLDELKELMEYLGAENGQRMQRLEKADVLEVTVKHLRNLKENGLLNANESQMSGSSTFRNGYSACASEVASFICSPYSGVQQPQAARIAMTVAEGLSRFQSPALRNSNHVSSHKPDSQMEAVDSVNNLYVKKQPESKVKIEDEDLHGAAGTPLDLSVK